MKPKINDLSAADIMALLPATFVRGAIASGIVAALGDKREGAALLHAALLGGGALATAVGVENLIFNKEWNMAKKKKGGKKKQHGALDLSALEALLRQQQQPSGLAALTPGQQLMVGVLVGAGIAYVLGDEKLRGKLLRAAMRLYTQLASGFEEVKEQMADIQAELAAEQRAA